MARIMRMALLMVVTWACDGVGVLGAGHSSILPEVLGASLHIWQRRQFLAWYRLVPKRGRGPIIHSFIEAVLPADLLYGDAAFLLPEHRIRQMPAIHGNKTLLVQTASVVKERRLLHAVGNADVVFTASPTNGGERGIPIHIDFDLSFSPPLRVIVSDSQNGSDEPPLPGTLQAYPFHLPGDPKLLGHFL